MALFNRDAKRPGW